MVVELCPRTFRLGSLCVGEEAKGERDTLTWTLSHPAASHCSSLSSSSRIRKSGGCRISHVSRGSFEVVILTTVGLSMDVILSMETVISSSLAIILDDPWSMMTGEGIAILTEECTQYLTHGSPQPNRIMCSRTKASLFRRQWACAVCFVQSSFKANNKSASVLMIILGFVYTYLISFCFFHSLSCF